ncbi:abortive infection protein [Gloeomargarita lithophora Alchichica-D10]|uniref:Abortive infection protein n=1 Tax=Gloeomargarita lithophora Alchichica-D10 TaxID=1188229 RepID=A0A1J0AFW9_9CYAN|nr:type II CAAX endopeptidase family protein [Gloeomargarita lithophora]APB34836.1 abortive infection protein [Gloeomargarita lithophora Alchichica-D10]
MTTSIFPWRRWWLPFLTLAVAGVLALSFLSSWQQPQTQNPLQLRAVDVQLQASVWQGNPELTRWFSQSTLAQAEQVYRRQVQAGQKSLNPTELGQLAQLMGLGVIQAERGQVQAAQTTWQDVIQRIPPGELPQMAQVLQGLWGEPVLIYPEAEPLVVEYLSGWFAQVALLRLYGLQQREVEVAALVQEQQRLAEDAVNRLLVLVGLPLVGGTLGTILLLGLAVQWLLRGRQSLLGRGELPGWSVPWGGEVVLQVMVLWFVAFFGLGQVVLPLVVQLLGWGAWVHTPLGRALYVFISYASLIAAGVGILVVSLRGYQPLGNNWFNFRPRGRTWVWGVGGYLVAQPLVFLASWVNQALLQGRGGGNPLLPLLAQTQDPWVLAIFSLVIVVLAPLFEETIFRGFLLPSLTRNLPVGGAVVVSGAVFALAHLSVADVLPLTVLGMLLGFVYTRQRVLWAPILLHGLWNGGSLVALLVLGHG